MTFDGQYLTYGEYQMLGGVALDETPFNLLEFEARRRIDIMTFDRLKNLDSEEIPQEVKLCEYNLINSINNYIASMETIEGSGNIASENIDGYSVSYVSADKISQVITSKRAEVDNIIETYLLGVVVNGEHLMYCGVR